MSAAFMAVAMALMSAVAAWCFWQFRRWQVEPAPAVVIGAILATTCALVSLVLGLVGGTS